MKAFLASGLVAVATLLSGCGSMEFGGYQNPNRTLTGTVRYDEPQLLPQDAVMIVRLVDNTSNAQLPQIIGTQTINNPGPSPVRYKIDYTASDEQLIHGYNIDVRVSYGGKLKLYNTSQYAVKLDNANTERNVSLSPVQ
jgi:uncharacterized lipoprotein YbaY